MGGFNVVDGSFVHGDGFRIGEFNRIHENVRVGDDVTIRNFIELRPGTVIGDGCYIDSGVKSSGQNRIGNNVVIRYDTILAREVTVEDDVFISPQVTTVYKTHERKAVGGILIGRGAFIGTNATLMEGVRIGSYVVIGAKALVTRDCLERGVYTGIPARLRRRIEGG